MGHLSLRAFPRGVLGGSSGEHSLKVARSARAVQRFPQEVAVQGMRIARVGFMPVLALAPTQMMICLCSSVLHTLRDCRALHCWIGGHSFSPPLLQTADDPETQPEHQVSMRSKDSNKFSHHMLHWLRNHASDNLPAHDA